MDILCVVVLVLSAQLPEVLKEADVSQITLEDAQRFHLAVQELLPQEARLIVGGFPARKRVRGVLTLDRTKESLGTWIVIDHSEKERGEGVPRLSIRLIPRGSADVDSIWERWGVVVKAMNNEDDQSRRWQADLARKLESLNKESLRNK